MESNVQSRSEPSSAAKREAAVWVARIHSPDRTPLIDAGLRRWLKESVEHQHAFDLANELWEAAGRIPDGAVTRLMRWQRVTPARSLAPAIGLAAMVLTVVAGIAYYASGTALETGIGEQRTVTLRDGTRVSLNTATRLAVRYDKAMRRIELASGEALFEVAADVRRPFVVNAGNREITALGTAFIVRRDPLRTAVTLVDGKVQVSTLSAVDLPAQDGAQRPRTPALLNPGERLTFTSNEPPTLDRPRLDKITAWRRGLLALDRTPLADAAAEMNRYSDVKLIVRNPEAARAPISGVFRAGDSELFAQAIVQTYQLQVTEEPGRIVIGGIPRGSDTR